MIEIEPEFEPAYTTHYDFRAGRWWECVQPQCDTVHHYYVRTTQPAWLR